MPLKLSILIECDTMKTGTRMSSPTNHIVADMEVCFSNNLNIYFTRFESQDHSLKCTEILKTIKPATSDRIVIAVVNVRKSYRYINTKKAAGPDECSAFLLKNFATELAPVWKPIFQASVDSHSVPLLWKHFVYKTTTQDFMSKRI